MKLLYVCTWDKIRENTFSGTTYFLFKALQSKCEVEDLDVSLTKIQKCIIKLFSIRVINGKLKFVDFFSEYREKYFEKNLNNKLEKYNNAPIIQIGSYGKCKNDCYTYQDLSIDSLLFYKNNNPELFKYSGFDNIPINEMKKSRDRQVKLYEECKGIFTMSQWLAKNMIEYTNIPKEKIHAVGAGINIDRKKIKPKNRTNNKILFVGRDFFRKGGDLTYNAYKILKNKYMDDAELYVAGPKEWPLEEKIQGVTFLGDLNYDQLSEYFNKCDIFCLPSRFEAYGLVFAEALVYGLPCIGRNEFAMKEFINDGKNGYLIDSDDENILAIKMFNLLKNDEIRKNVLDNREIYINKYSWDSVAERILDIIKK